MSLLMLLLLFWNDIGYNNLKNFSFWSFKLYLVLMIYQTNLTAIGW